MSENFILTYLDAIIGPVYLLLIYLWAKSYQRKRQDNYPVYRWYTRGLMVKCFAGIAVCLIYQLYYGGGDTVNYGYNANVMANVIKKNPIMYFRMLMGEHDWDVYGVFDTNTGYPFYWRDLTGFYTACLFAPLCLIAFNTYIGTTLLLVTICYIGVWRLFLLFNHVFPQLEKQFVISILFIPSVVFWGSGLLKDTITFGAVGLFTAHFYSMFIQKKFSIANVLYILVAVYFMAKIKPYILFALLPGSIVWLSNERLAKITSRALRAMIAPFILILSFGGGYVLLNQMGNILGDYALDSVLEKAVISNTDQKQAYYGGNSFDIGDFDATASGVGSKAHLAVFATLFRPTLLEARNPLMLLSALENTYILVLTVFLLIRLKFIGFIRFIGEKPLLLFSVMFALFFAFSVGIATSNFGTLVRLKIPCIPFFVSSLFVIRHLYEQKTNKKLGI